LKKAETDQKYEKTDQQNEIFKVFENGETDQKYEETDLKFKETDVVISYNQKCMMQ